MSIAYVMRLQLGWVQLDRTAASVVKDLLCCYVFFFSPQVLKYYNGKTISV